MLMGPDSGCSLVWLLCCTESLAKHAARIESLAPDQGRCPLRPRWHADQELCLVRSRGDADQERCLARVASQRAYWSGAVPRLLVPKGVLIRSGAFVNVGLTLA